MRTYNDLRPGQKKAATFIYERDAGIVVIPMGGGKTVTFMTVVDELIRDGVIRGALVMAPAVVAQNVWPYEAEEWAHLRNLTVVPLVGTPAKRMALLNEHADIWTISFELTEWLINDAIPELPDDHPVRDMIIFDEVTRLASPKGDRAKLLRDRAGLWRMRWGATGTPRHRGAEGLFMPATIITRGNLWGKSFYKWQEKNFICINPHVPGGKWTIAPWARDKVYAEYGSIAYVQEDEIEGPEVVDLVHWFDLPPDAMAEYKRMERHLLVDVGAQQGPIVALNQAVKSGKLEQIANGFVYDDAGHGHWLHQAKLKLTDELALAAAEPSIIVFHYGAERERLGEHAIAGGVSPKQKQQLVKDWNEGLIDRLLLHPASGGHGLNLQHGGRRMIFHHTPWSAEMYDQTRKRIARPGQKKQCFMHHVFARDTIDVIKYNRVMQGMTESEAFTDYLRRVK